MPALVMAAAIFCLRSPHQNLRPVQLLFARAFDVANHRLDFIGLQFNRNHLIFALGNGVGDLFIHVALPELGIAEIVGFGVEGLGQGAFAVPFLAMASLTFGAKNCFAVLSPTAIWGPQDNYSQEQSGHCPEN